MVIDSCSTSHVQLSIRLLRNCAARNGWCADGVLTRYGRHRHAESVIAGAAAGHGRKQALLRLGHAALPILRAGGVPPQRGKPAVLSILRRFPSLDAASLGLPSSAQSPKYNWFETMICGALTMYVMLQLFPSTGRYCQQPDRPGRTANTGKRTSTSSEACKGTQRLPLVLRMRC